MSSRHLQKRSTSCECLDERSSISFWWLFAGVGFCLTFSLPATRVPQEFCNIREGAELVLWPIHMLWFTVDCLLVYCVIVKRLLFTLSVYCICLILFTAISAHCIYCLLRLFTTFTVYCVHCLQHLFNFLFTEFPVYCIYSLLHLLFTPTVYCISCLLCSLFTAFRPTVYCDCLLHLSLLFTAFTIYPDYTSRIYCLLQ